MKSSVNISTKLYVFQKSLFIISAVFALLIMCPTLHAGTSAQNDLLQFTAGGHVVGFEPDRFYMATGTHVLSVEFVGTEGVAPQTCGVSETPQVSSEAMPLTSVTYRNLYDGITLTYDSEPSGIMKSTWRIEPSANPSMIRFRWRKTGL